MLVNWWNSTHTLPEHICLTSWGEMHPYNALEYSGKCQCDPDRHRGMNLPRNPMGDAILNAICEWQHRAMKASQNRVTLIWQHLPPWPLRPPSVSGPPASIPHWHPWTSGSDYMNISVQACCIKERGRTNVFFKSIGIGWSSWTKI